MKVFELDNKAFEKGLRGRLEEKIACTESSAYFVINVVQAEQSATTTGTAPFVLLLPAGNRTANDEEIPKTDRRHDQRVCDECGTDGRAQKDDPVRFWTAAIRDGSDRGWWSCRWS